MKAENTLGLILLIVCLVVAIGMWDDRRQERRRRQRIEDVQTWKDVLGL